MGYRRSAGHLGRWKPFYGTIPPARGEAAQRRDNLLLKSQVWVANCGASRAEDYDWLIATGDRWVFDEMEREWYTAQLRMSRPAKPDPESVFSFLWHSEEMQSHSVFVRDLVNPIESSVASTLY